jgi:hypothetical protein
MYPQRSDSTGETPGSLWLFVSGDSARAWDGQDSPSPLIIQTRLGDLLYRLQERVEPLGRRELRSTWRSVNDHVLEAAERAMRERGADPTVISEARRTHVVTLPVLNALAWLAVSAVGRPADVSLPRDTIVAPYERSVLNYGPPDILFASAPFRALWLRASTTEGSEPVQIAPVPVGMLRAGGMSTVVKLGLTGAAGVVAGWLLARR